MTRINNVLISAGIHGNEKTGIYLIKKFQTNPDSISRPSFTTNTLLANSKAIELNHRYYKTDLNRCFDTRILNNPNPESYEEVLAHNLNQQIQESEIDFILDVHTTTSNMGLTLLLSNDDPFNLQLAAYLVSIDPQIKIVRTINTSQNNRFRSIFPLGFTLEIGAIATNVIDSIWFSRAEILIGQILDYIEKNNQQQQPKFSTKIISYLMFKAIYFPLDDQGEIMGMVHPQIHGNDYCVLNPGEPMFINFNDTLINYQESQPVYPIFVNEAAYWENKIAMYLTTKEKIVIPINN